MVNYPILLEKHGHAGYGEPANPRRPAQEFYQVPYPPPAFDDNNDVRRAPPSEPREQYEGQITRGLALHVDAKAERKRIQMDHYRGINDGMGCSAATWLRRDIKTPPHRSAGANHPPRPAKGQMQNFQPGRTRPHSAHVPEKEALYTGQGTVRRGFLVEPQGTYKNKVLHDAEPWELDWKEHNNTDWPVVKRLREPRKVDGKGNNLAAQGVGSLFNREDRRGNRERARVKGGGGIFSGAGGKWLKRMVDSNAFATPGGIHGAMRQHAGTDQHHPVGDGWAPPRTGNDGWGAKRYAVKGSHYEEARKPAWGGGRGVGRPNQPRVVTKFGRHPAKPGPPVKLKPGCWRAGCLYPHGEDRKDDLLHGLPYEGLSKTLTSGRHLAGHGPAKRQTWTARPPSAPARAYGGGGHVGYDEQEPAPWSGYVAFTNYF